jgi:hypothetical protein
VKRKSILAKSKSDWARLESAARPANPTRGHPEADIRHIVRGVVRRGLQPLQSKVPISLHRDQDVLK